MDLNSLILKNQSSQPLIQKDADPEKYNLVVAKLCDKRKALESSLNDQTLDHVTREEMALNLIQLKESMAVFGISEIDYQAYLLKDEENTQQTSLFEETP